MSDLLYGRERFVILTREVPRREHLNRNELKNIALWLRSNRERFGAMCAGIILLASNETVALSLRPAAHIYRRKLRRPIRIAIESHLDAEVDDLLGAQ